MIGGSWLRRQGGRALVIVIAMAGCRKPPPPPALPPAPPPPPPVVREAPPPPKCETAEEACVARAETRARIPHVSNFEVGPPAGWTYVQGSDVTVMTGRNAVLGVTTHPTGPDPKKERNAREESLELLTQQLGVAMARKKDVFWRKPDQKQKVGDLEVFLYQVDGAKRSGKTGPLLVFVGRLADGRTLLGAGFVSNDDVDNADQAILKAIGSITPSATPGVSADSKTSP